MKIDDIVIGRVYAMKVSGRIAPVRIDGARTTPWRGTRSGLNRRMRKFWGVNLRTGRTIDPISPARVRQELEQFHPGDTLVDDTDLEVSDPFGITHDMEGNRRDG